MSAWRRTLRARDGPPLRAGPSALLRILLAAPWRGRSRCWRRRSLAFLLVYVASLVVLFVSSFWTRRILHSEVAHTWNVANYRMISRPRAAYPTSRCGRSGWPPR